MAAPQMQAASTRRKNSTYCQKGNWLVKYLAKVTILYPLSSYAKGSV